MFSRWNCLAAILMVVSVMDVAASARPATGDDTVSVGTGVGQMYPDFLLPNIDGGWGRLSDARGKKTLLIHFASW